MTIRKMYDRSFIVDYKEGDSSLEIVPDIMVQQDTDQIHRVIDGETLVAIAEKYYGSPEPWFLIMQANDIVKPWEITPGQELIIPTIEL